MHRAVKVRIYPNKEQSHQLNRMMGCARWWWNFALNLCNQTYKETGKGVSQIALNKELPKLKKAEETAWLAECHSQVLQSTTLNLTTAFKNFFDKRAKYPRFKSYSRKQSIQFPQSVKIVDGELKLPKINGLIKASIHRLFDGEIKTVTISKNPSGKYYASLLFETNKEFPEVQITGKTTGIDLGLLDFAVTFDGDKIRKYPNPRHLKRHEKNLARKQQKLSRKQKGSNSRNKARKQVAKVHERISNARQDYLHKLSRKIVDKSQVVVVENLNIKGMVRNHSLAKAISDVGWGMFVNFIDYKLKEKGGLLIEIDRFFPSSKTCSNCLYQIGELQLNVRQWICPHCGIIHDRDGNAAMNIRAEGLRMLQAGGTLVSADRGEVKPKGGRKSVLRCSPVKSEAPPSSLDRAG
jgi:putative transposase